MEPKRELTQRRKLEIPVQMGEQADGHATVEEFESTAKLMLRGQL